MSLSDFFGDEADYVESRDASREMSWESTAVRLVLRGLNLCSLRQLQEPTEEFGAKPRATFAALHQRYYTLPCVFSASRVQRVHEISVEDLLRRFTKTRIFQAWELCTQQMGETAVMVFPWPHVGTAVVHQFEPDREAEGLVIRRFFKDVTYTVETLERYLVGLSKVWQP